MEVDYSLFTKKEMYVMEHTISGRLTRIECLPKMVRRKKMYENMLLTDGMTFTSRNHIPQLLPYNGKVDFELVAYSHNFCAKVRISERITK